MHPCENTLNNTYQNQAMNRRRKICVCTIAAGEITSDAAAATESESAFDSDIETLKQVRVVEKVAEAREFVFDGSLQWVAARTGWGAVGIQVFPARNQVLGATGGSSGLRLCQTHRQGQNHHQPHQTFASSHFLVFFPTPTIDPVCRKF